jgi:hypothetical protein
MREGPSAPIILASDNHLGAVGGLIEAAMQEEGDQRIRAAIAARGFRTVPVAADRRGGIFQPPIPRPRWMPISTFMCGSSATSPAPPPRPAVPSSCSPRAWPRPMGGRRSRRGSPRAGGSDTLITRDRPGPEGHDIAASTAFDANPDGTLAGRDAGLAAMARHIVAALR